jgi:hypothetical protein
LSTIIRRKRNSIDAIQSDTRDWITNRRKLRFINFLENFSELFSEEEVSFPTYLEDLIPGRDKEYFIWDGSTKSTWTHGC